MRPWGETFEVFPTTAFAAPMFGLYTAVDAAPVAVLALSGR